MGSGVMGLGPGGWRSSLSSRVATKRRPAKVPAPIMQPA